MITRRTVLQGLFLGPTALALCSSELPKGVFTEIETDEESSLTWEERGNRRVVVPLFDELPSNEILSHKLGVLEAASRVSTSRPGAGGHILSHPSWGARKIWARDGAGYVVRSRTSGRLGIFVPDVSLVAVVA